MMTKVNSKVQKSVENQSTATAPVRTCGVIPGTLLTEQLSLHQLKFRQERWGQHVCGLVTSKLLQATA